MKRLPCFGLAVFVFISFLVSTFVLFTPVPRASTDGFSAVAAAAHLAVIAAEPHSVFDREAHEEVRSYLVEQFGTYVGAGNVVEMDYAAADVDPDIDYPIENVLATIPGDSPKGILLVAHYDSRGHIGRTGELGRSYGAADDGYGLAVLLEIARLYGNRELANSIYLLATDGEETGLYGAAMAAQEDFMDDVAFVINVEARGVDGAAYMFETSADNAAVLAFYAAADLPVSYSMATAVYAVMPNMTDFTEFTAIGKAGVNFAVLRGLYYYHTPLDSYIHIDLSSLQHYGSQIVPLVETFATDPKYAEPDAFAATENAIFFTILPGVLVRYSETAGLVMTIVAFLVFGLLVFVFVRRKLLRPLAVFRHAGIVLATVVAAFLVGWLLGNVIAFFGKTPYSLTYVRMEGADLPTLVIVVGMLVDLYFLLRRFVKPEGMRAAMLGGIFVNLVLALATSVVLSGASFLFFVPAAVGLVSLAVDGFVADRRVRTVALSQNLFWNAVLVVPLVYSLYLALTVGGLPALLVLVVIDASVVLPATRMLVARA